jgi:hypothetical protein
MTASLGDAFAALPRACGLQPHEWSVWAGLSCDAGWVALASGTKCVGSDTGDPTGRVVVDCHAEVLARRAWQRVLLLEAERHVRGCTVLRTGGSEGASAGTGPQWGPCTLRACAAGKVGAGGPFLSHGAVWPLLRPADGVRWRLAVSDMPCGCAAEYADVHVDVEVGVEAGADGGAAGGSGAAVHRHEGRVCGGPLRSAGGAGGVGHRVTGAKATSGEVDGTVALRTKSGRSDLPAAKLTRSHCCSDKVSLWCGAGLQGALLCHWLERPIPLAEVRVIASPLPGVRDPSVALASRQAQLSHALLGRWVPPAHAPGPDSPGFAGSHDGHMVRTECTVAFEALPCQKETVAARLASRGAMHSTGVQVAIGDGGAAPVDGSAAAVAVGRKRPRPAHIGGSDDVGARPSLPSGEGHRRGEEGPLPSACGGAFAAVPSRLAGDHSGRAAWWVDALTPTVGLRAGTVVRRGKGTEAAPEAPPAAAVVSVARAHLLAAWQGVLAAVAAALRDCGADGVVPTPLAPPGAEAATRSPLPHAPAHAGPALVVAAGDSVGAAAAAYPHGCTYMQACKGYAWERGMDPPGGAGSSSAGTDAAGASAAGQQPADWACVTASVAATVAHPCSILPAVQRQRLAMRSQPRMGVWRGYTPALLRHATLGADVGAPASLGTHTPSALALSDAAAADWALWQAHLRRMPLSTS